MLIRYCINVYSCNFHVIKGKIDPAHTMAAYGSGGMASLILNFGIRWA